MAWNNITQETVYVKQSFKFNLTTQQQLNMKVFLCRHSITTYLLFFRITPSKPLTAAAAASSSFER